MVRQSVCKHAPLSKMDNDRDFYIGILVDGLLYCKSSVCVGSMTIINLLSNSTPQIVVLLNNLYRGILYIV